MWVSKREWQDMRDTVYRLERELRQQQIVVYKDEAKTVKPKSVPSIYGGGYWLAQAWQAVPPHTSISYGDAIKMLADHAGLEFKYRDAQPVPKQVVLAKKGKKP